jgi:hypothetical protein
LVSPEFDASSSPRSSSPEWEDEDDFEEPLEAHQQFSQDPSQSADFLELQVPSTFPTHTSSNFHQAVGFAVFNSNAGNTFTRSIFLQQEQAVPPFQTPGTQHSIPRPSLFRVLASFFFSNFRIPLCSGFSLRFKILCAFGFFVRFLNSL